MHPGVNPTVVSPDAIQWWTYESHGAQPYRHESRGPVVHSSNGQNLHAKATSRKTPLSETPIAWNPVKRGIS